MVIYKLCIKTLEIYRYSENIKIAELKYLETDLEL